MQYWCTPCRTSAIVDWWADIGRVENVYISPNPNLCASKTGHIILCPVSTVKLFVAEWTTARHHFLDNKYSNLIHDKISMIQTQIPHVWYFESPFLSFHSVWNICHERCCFLQFITMLGPSPSLQESAGTKTEKEISSVWYHTFCFYSLIRQVLSEAPFLRSNTKLGSPEKPRQLAYFLNFSRWESFRVCSLAGKKKRCVLHCMYCVEYKMCYFLRVTCLFLPIK